MAYPIPFPTFQPAMRLITAITLGNPVEVTTAPDHQYFTGTIVRLYVYPANGMVQVNKAAGAITVTGVNTFTMDLDTSNFNTFIVPVAPTANNTQACVVPIGEVTELLKAAVQNVLPY